MGTIARGRGAGLEKYSLCGGACHSRPGPLGWRAGLCCPSCKALAEGPQSQHQDPWAVSTSTVTCPVSLSSVQPSHPHSQCPTQSQHNTGSIKARKKTALGFAHLPAHPFVLGPQYPTDSCGFQRPESSAQTPATTPTQQFQEDTLWSAACKVLHILGVASNPSVPHPQTTSSKARYL